MNNIDTLISKEGIRRLKVQGYSNFTEAEISRFRFGNRFAYVICSTVFLIGLVTTSVPVLLFLMAIAFLGIILPNHPFDFIYNNLLAGRMGKPKLPPRSKQLKFACTIATVGLGVTAWLFYSNFLTVGYLLGGSLFLVALLVSTTDICIPSIIYNYLFNYKIDKS